MPELRPMDREPDDEGGGDFRSKPRWSANRKMDVVMGLLRGEPIDQLSRELGAEAHRLAAWRDDFISGGKEALKTRAGVGSAEESRRLREAGRKIGQLTMENEILQAAARKRGLQIRRRSGRGESRDRSSS